MEEKPMRELEVVVEETDGAYVYEAFINVGSKHVGGVTGLSDRSAWDAAEQAHGVLWELGYDLGNVEVKYLDQNGNPLQKEES